MSTTFIIFLLILFPHLEIAFGSNITLKNFGYGGGLLHSHASNYPDGSKQQQITGYTFRDTNNNWQLRHPRDVSGAMPDNGAEIQYVKDGDVIRLFHILTGRNLHSHPINAPISSKHWEVSAYGTEEYGDVQDNWKVEVVKDISGINSNTVKALTTRFRLRHVFLGCLLASRNVALPQWGFRQQEVVCDRKSSPSDPHTWWNVEEHHNTACKVLYTSYRTLIHPFYYSTTCA